MTITIMEAAQSSAEGALSADDVCTLERCEVAIQAGKEAFLRVATALLTIRDRRLYRQTHSSFEDYLRERWEMGKSHGADPDEWPQDLRIRQYPEVSR